ncbi:TSC22 domain family protein 3 isoform X3 [Callithrix jacchus]|uniref:TSC22 domain family protein 3 isoform X3 n=2 Tax=Platyrrhini TaxID=9479 RepID=UPI00159ECD14|nr:TSC22 domain family protein 3 isoform X3 [Callithrix jacchus]
MKVERLEEPQLMEEPQLGEDPELGEEAQFLEELQLEVVESGSDLDPEDLGSSPDFATNLMLELDASGASVVAIDNKIEQAMDLVKNHLMYAVREEVEVLKEQIRELVEKNSQLERENTLLKTLASPEQLEKFQSRLIPEEPAPESPQVPEAPGGSAV